jgi:hypothetical protein
MVARAEDLLAPCWARIAGGCHPNRDPVSAIRGAGFEQIAVRRLPFSPVRGVPAFAHIIGRAVAPGS